MSDRPTPRRVRFHRLIPEGRGLCVLLLATALLAGCGAPDGEVTIDTEILPLYFETLGLGQTATLTDTTEVLIRDADTWETYQRRLQPPRAFKAVDFTQTMVVLVAVPVPTGGYSVEVESVETVAEGIEVTYVFTIPDEDCIPIMAPAVPFQAVMVRRAEGEPRFSHRTELFHCEMQHRN